MTNSGELSPLDYDIAFARRKEQPNYRFESVEDYSALNEKTLVGILGTTGSGQTSLTKAVVKISSEFKTNGLRTTRARKPTDPANYLTAEDGITHQSINQDIIDHRLVNYSVLDTGHIYGTTPEDIGEYAIGPILSESTDNLSTAGFKKFHPVFMLARGALLQQRLEQERLTYPDMRARLVGAIGILSSARAYSDDPWMNFIDMGNSSEELDAAAKTVINIVDQGAHPFITTKNILQLIDEMEQAVRSVSRKLG